MLPLYMQKAKVDEKTIKEKINEESWLGANETSEIFDVNILEEQKQVAACTSELLKTYKNVPEKLKNISNKPKFDYSAYEKRLLTIKK